MHDHEIKSLRIQSTQCTQQSRNGELRPQVDFRLQHEKDGYIAGSGGSQLMKEAAAKQQDCKINPPKPGPTDHQTTFAPLKFTK